ncbi:hypothetical protein ACBY01_02105 [Sphingomonas sp. ac-8]|uniref:hypothetical protein n=1 Tax=Sphingomonas sp. ac-8 TaxID=3242977 RepID=UPI003A80141D
MLTGRDEAVALSLMNMALALLDRAESHTTAVHLQLAIDTLRRAACRAPTPSEIDAFLERWSKAAPPPADNRGDGAPEADAAR